MEEKELLRLLLPAGLLDYFKITSAKFNDGNYYIYLEEQNIHPEHLQGAKLTSKGFYDEVSIQDFPLRGKACFLKIKRRKWLNEDTGKNVSRDWNLVANGTRMTEEFALFLKRNDWIQPL
ncbi:transposase [uncultured Cyclobacterium sp.]|uniref:ISAon1 family transposase N-terminal region protein n=1 Tax=uncultured Cyclobacterium sp. TaxID=453820 RepID=UPI0030EEB964